MTAEALPPSSLYQAEGWSAYVAFSWAALSSLRVASTRCGGKGTDKSGRFRASVASLLRAEATPSCTLVRYRGAQRAQVEAWGLTHSEFV